jgi:hypothetical protein
MKRGRIFTDEELELLGARTADLIDAALDAGDVQKAKKLSHRMAKECLAMHDLYLWWVTSMLSFIYRRYGDEVMYEALSEGYGLRFREAAEKVIGQDPRRKAEILAGGNRGHQLPMKIAEDDEKITFFMGPCGSGGRLMLEKAYGPPMNLAKIKKAQPMTFGRKDFPIYCAHCFAQEVLPMQWFGEPVFVVEPADKIGEEPCRLHIYKDPKKVPAEFRERIAKLAR